MSETLYAALAKAQAEMPNAVLNKTNPHFKNKYADLAALRAATLPSLSKHGLSILQFTRIGLEQFVLVTRLAHASGDFIDGEYPLPNMPDKPQIMGSAMTYARRYGWGAILGEASEEDDDAEAAHSIGQKIRNPATGRMIDPNCAHQLRKTGVYEDEERGIRACETPEDLKKFGTALGGRIVDWNDQWKRNIREEYANRLTELEEGVTEEGTLVDKLQKSIDKHDAEVGKRK